MKIKKIVSKSQVLCVKPHFFFFLSFSVKASQGSVHPCLCVFLDAHFGSNLNINRYMSS